MQRTRREIVDQALTFKGELGDDDARVLAEQLLNEAIETIWLKHAWQAFVMPTQFEITTVVGQRSYVLPDYFGRLPPKARVRNLTTGRELEPLSVEDLRGIDARQGTSLEPSGDPFVAAFGGVQGVQQQPTTASACEVVSSDVNDTDVVVTLEGYDDAGLWQSVQVALTGTVAAAVGTWAHIDNFAKAFQEGTEPTGDGLSSRGTVTLRTTAPVTLQVLAPHEAAKEQVILTLYPRPASVCTIGVPVLRAPKKLVKDADEVPRHWGPAVLEEMRIQWDVQSGTMSEGEGLQLPRPKFLELLAFDQATKVRPRVRGFRG